jgi:hypothetical protein
MEDRRLDAHRWLRLPGLLQGEAPPCMSVDADSEHSLGGRQTKDIVRIDRPPPRSISATIRAMPASSDNRRENLSTPGARQRLSG